MALSNADIAEFLAREAEGAKDMLRRAYKRAARAAHLWPTEACDLVSRGESLKQLPAIGPFLEKRLVQWIETAAEGPEPPPIRRHFLTLSGAKKILSQNPGWGRAYRGDLQMHSRWSDGAATIQEMAHEAQSRGYEYIAITDHSVGLKIAGGISSDQLRQQITEIDRLNRTNSGFVVLRSLELNLNPDGDGDMDDASLSELDLVVGSFHSQLRRKEDQTSRYLAALQNPQVTILGHPVGRIYNHRQGLSADWPRVFARAAELDKALEVDSYPDRQDLSVELLKIAKAEGTRIAIDTDAHAPDQLGFVELGLAAAFAARIPRERIINFMPREELLCWSASLRATRGALQAKSRKTRPIVAVS